MDTKPLLFLALAACAAPSADDRFAKLEQDVASLTKRLDGLAGPKPTEFTAMTIESVVWWQDFSKDWGRPDALYCRISEWQGWESMKLFTQRVDPKFVLEADGLPDVQATMSEGGVTGDNGATRMVVLNLHGHLDPAGTYSLRPLNTRKPYTWVVLPEVRIAGRR